MYLYESLKISGKSHEFQTNPINSSTLRVGNADETWATPSSHQFTLFATRVNISNEPRKTLGSTQNILAKHCKLRNLLIWIDIVFLNYIKIRLKRNVLSTHSEHSRERWPGHGDIYYALCICIPIDRYVATSIRSNYSFNIGMLSVPIHISYVSC